MGACNADDDRTPGERRVGPRIKLFYEHWHWQMPENPPEWDRMGPLERAEWEAVRNEVEVLRLATCALQNRGLLESGQPFS